MCPLGYHHNGFVVTHALCVNHTSCAQVHELLRGHRSDNWEGTSFIRLFIHYIPYHYKLLKVNYLIEVAPQT